MSASGATLAPGSARENDHGSSDHHVAPAQRLSTETKASFKTTEFFAFLGVVAAILVSAALIKGGDTGGTDEFVAHQAWLYVAIVTGAYMVSRGLAKSGSREPYTSGNGS